VPRRPGNADEGHADGVEDHLVLGDRKRHRAPLEAALAKAHGPVLLVDDRVDTGWTMTLAAKLLRECGAPAVLPFALALRVTKLAAGHPDIAKLATAHAVGAGRVREYYRTGSIGSAGVWCPSACSCRAGRPRRRQYPEASRRWRPPRRGPYIQPATGWPHWHAAIRSPPPGSTSAGPARWPATGRFLAAPERWDFGAGEPPGGWGQSRIGG
jgi:hypothetical protein